jgi:hypothetical protein
MQLLFKEWVNGQQFDEVINLKNFIKMNPWLLKVFSTRGLPKNLQQWSQGFRNGQQAVKLGWPPEENPHRNQQGQADPEDIDLYNGWIDGYHSAVA